MAAHPCGRHVAVRIVRHRPAKQPSGGRRLHWRDDQNLLCAHRASLSIAPEKRMIAAADSADDAARSPGSATGPARTTEIRDAPLLIAHCNSAATALRAIAGRRGCRVSLRRGPVGGADSGVKRGGGGGGRGGGRRTGGGGGGGAGGPPRAPAGSSGGREGVAVELQEVVGRRDEA